MWMTKLVFAEKYNFQSEDFHKAYRFLRRKDLTELKPGRYEIEGDRVFVLIQEYTTKNPEEALFEAHNQYLDIQYMIKGEEHFAITDRSGLSSLEAVPYEEDKDIVFYRDPQNVCWTTLKEGGMIVVGPDDAHKPCCWINAKPLPVKKAVVKLRVGHEEI